MSSFLAGAPDCRVGWGDGGSGRGEGEGGGKGEGGGVGGKSTSKDNRQLTKLMFEKKGELDVKLVVFCPEKRVPIFMLVLNKIWHYNHTIVRKEFQKT